jgi:hypothetical protein
MIGTLGLLYNGEAQCWTKQWHGLGLSDFSVLPKAQIKVLGTPLPACQIQNAK